MTTRNTTSKTATAKAAAQAAHADTQQDDNQSIFATARELAASMGIYMPTGKLLAVSTIVSIGAGVFTAYGLAQITAYLVVGAALLTGSAFIGWIIGVLAVIVTVYMSLLTVSKTFAYMASGQLEGDMARAKSWVTGLFGKKNEVTA